jgi:hypothetical protein
MKSESGAELDDPRYVPAWKEIRGETLAILANLRCYVEAEADVLADAFGTKMPEERTDGEILRWRRWKERLKLIEDHGECSAADTLMKGGSQRRIRTRFRFPIRSVASCCKTHGQLTPGDILQLKPCRR